MGSWRGFLRGGRDSFGGDRAGSLSAVGDGHTFCPLTRKLRLIKSKDRPWAPTEVGSGTGHVAKKHNKLRPVLRHNNPPGQYQ